MKGFGWSSESEELFKKYNKDLFIDNAGTFTIMKVSDIFALFPKSALTFPSPNFYTKKDKGYSTTYYLNLFKEKIVNDVSDGGLGWNTYGINSSHHLRAFFISYMLRKKGVLPLDVCEITGHNLNTMMRYYTRVSEESKRNTLQKSKLRDILKS